jgi:hypothetical protein
MTRGGEQQKHRAEEGDGRGDDAGDGNAPAAAPHGGEGGEDRSADASAEAYGKEEELELPAKRRREAMREGAGGDYGGERA